MFDPAAMGTLRIGLDGDRAETHHHRRHAPVRTKRPARAGARVALAGVLRRAADLLERRPVSEGAA